MSLMIARRLWPEFAMTSAQRRWRGGISVCVSSSAMTMMPFIGVRISWLMVARKSDFARLAASAASRASRRSWVRSATSCSRLRLCASRRTIALPNVAEHRVEAVDQHADFPIARVFERHVVGVVLAHTRHRGDELLQRPRDAALEAPTHHQPDDERDQSAEGRGCDRPDQAPPQAGSAADQDDLTRRLAAVDDGGGYQHGPAGEQIEHGLVPVQIEVADQPRRASKRGKRRAIGRPDLRVEDVRQASDGPNGGNAPRTGRGLQPRRPRPPRMHAPWQGGRRAVLRQTPGIAAIPKPQPTRSCRCRPPPAPRRSACGSAIDGVSACSCRKANPLVNETLKR